MELDLRKGLETRWVILHSEQGRQICIYMLLYYILSFLESSMASKGMELADNHLDLAPYVPL